LDQPIVDIRPGESWIHEPGETMIWVRTIPEAAEGLIERRAGVVLRQQLDKWSGEEIAAPSGVERFSQFFLAGVIPDGQGARQVAEETVLEPIG
jgi:hypothetical protein